MRPFHRRWIATLLLSATVGAAGLTVPAGAALPDGALSKVSPVGASGRPAIDDAGSTVAYIQGATGNVMVNDQNIVPDAGAQEIDLSGDGSTVVFSTDKGLADGNGVRDIYAVGRDGGGLRLVSGGAAGVGSFSPSVNGNGAVVAFSAGNVPSGVRKIFVKDGGAEVEAPLPAGEGCDCVNPSISANGRVAAFEITDSGVFVWDRDGGTGRIAQRGSTRPSMAGNGSAVAFTYQNTVNVFNRSTRELQTAPEEGQNPALSADGAVVAYQASRPLTFVTDTNGQDDVVVWEARQDGRITAASLRGDGRTGTGGSFNPALNANGGRVAFDSNASDLVAGDNNGLSDIFMRVPGDGTVAPPCCGAPSGPPATGVVDTDPDIPGAYWLVASDGGVFAFAGPENVAKPQFYGSAGAIKLNQPIVGSSAHPSGQGYWFVASDGGVFNYGAAKFFGSTGAIKLNRPIVAMASTPSGNGYWLVASDGGIFSFGDAKFFGSTGGIKLNRPIVGMAPTPSGAGYWLVADDGGIFSFGDAKFFGSTGAIKLNKPIVGMAARPQGDGYWMVASDGGVFSFGNAPFKGSTGAIKLNQPIVGMAPTKTGIGYWFVASDGGVFTFGDAGFFGSTGNIKLNKPIVGMSGFNF